MNLMELAKSMQDSVLAARHQLHQIPETRYETRDTRDFIKAALASFKKGVVPMSVKESKGGIVADLDASSTKDRILFRADFDALPVTEATGLPFSSTRPGKMHACGHDIHTAMLLVFLKCVAQGSVELNHNLRIVFQDAEENPGTAPEPISGGDMLVKEGVCDGISSAHMLHIWATGKSGVFSSRPGALLGNSGRIKFVIRATGGHAAQPHKGTNVLRITHEIQSVMDSIAARYLPPTEPTALEPVILNAGKGSNVMPAEAELWFGCRTMLPRFEHALFMDAIELEVRAIVSRFPGASVEVTKINGHPSLINAEADFNRVRELLKDAGQSVSIEPPLLGGEDFAHYLYKVPGSAWMLGAHQEGTGDHHAPTFNPDESVFWKGVYFWLLLATN